MNLVYRTKMLQVIVFWRLSDFGRWRVRVWRWPIGEMLERIERAGWPDFGFTAVTLGPIEFRYWPRTMVEVQS